MNSAVLRILDANANRAREALRGLEDYARFALNDAELAAELKTLRHTLRSALEPILRDAILARDTPGDVGTGIKTPDELSRADIGQVVVAAGKRAGEALRTIAEYCKTLDPAAAAGVETLRYRLYAVEQTLLLMHRPKNERLEAANLCVLITENACANRDWMHAVDAAIAGGATMLQLREKDLEGDEFLARARHFVAACRKTNVISIINDRVDIAALSDADGVHVGQSDLPIRDARQLLGSRKIIGVSTHVLDHARAACRAGADYIGVGPVFPSTTKPRDFLAGLDYARQIAAADLPIPAFAISGISLSNLPELLATGMSRVAVTAACTGAADIAAATAQFATMLKAA